MHFSLSKKVNKSFGSKNRLTGSLEVFLGRLSFSLSTTLVSSSEKFNRMQIALLFLFHPGIEIH